MRGILSKPIYQNKAKAAKGPAKRAGKSLVKPPKTASRRWGLATRLEHRRIRDK